MAVYNPLKSRQVVFLADSTKLREFGLGLSPSDLRLTWRVVGREETGAPIDSTVTVAPPPHQANLTLIERAQGRRFLALSGHDRIIYDPVTTAGDEGPARKGAQ